MTKHTPIIEELEREMHNTAALSLALNARQALVTQHLPGRAAVDLTGQYEEGLRKASNALLKAVAALKKVDATD